MNPEPKFRGQNQDHVGVPPSGGSAPAQAGAPTADAAGEQASQAKLDAVGKAKVCAVISIGGTIKMAARFVGCSERAIHAARQRDPAFDEQIKQNRECPALVCLKTLHEAAQDKKTWRAADYYLKHVYPERAGHSAHLMPVEQARKMLYEIAVAIDSVVTDEATRERIAQCFSKITGQAPPRKRRKGLPQLPPSEAGDDLV